MKIVLGLVFILFINVLLFLTQVGFSEIISDEELSITEPGIYTYEGSILSQYDDGNYTVTQNISKSLPKDTATVQSDDGGNVFTDVFNTVKNWLLESSGLNYLFAFVNGFPNFLKGVGFPVPLAFALGALWHALFIFLIVAFLKGHW